MPSRPSAPRAPRLRSFHNPSNLKAEGGGVPDVGLAAVRLLLYHFRGHPVGRFISWHAGYVVQSVPEYDCIHVLSLFDWGHCLSTTGFTIKAFQVPVCPGISALRVSGISALHVRRTHRG